MMQSRIDTFAEKLASALRTPGGKGQAIKKLGTIADQCGSKVTRDFVAGLATALAKHGLHVSPALVFEHLRREDRVTISTKQIAASSSVFLEEKDLVKFVCANIGRGPFAGLKPFTGNRGKSAVEFQLPSRKRIDLLCEERNPPGRGALVAIEFKRGDGKGVLEQVRGYLAELRTMFPERSAKGIIISSSKEHAEQMLTMFPGQDDIAWHYYDVRFPRVRAANAISPTRPSR